MLRHGEAQAQAGQDSLRALTERGRQQARSAAEVMRGVRWRGLLHSPYRRAVQTTEEVCAALGLDFAEARGVSWLTPDTPVARTLEELALLEEGDWLLVSHQPLVGELASCLLHGHRQQPLAMATASLAVFEAALPLAGMMALLQHRHVAD